MMGMGQAQARAPQQEVRPAQPQQGDEGAGNVSPEEQAAYEQTVRNGEQLIYDEQNQPRENIVQSLSANQDPIQAVAATAVTIVGSLEQSAAQANHPIADDVLMAAGEEIVAMLADLSESLGIHDFTDEETDGAYWAALDMYREVNPGGRVNPDELKQQFGALMEADQQGRLGEVLPGLPQGGAAQQDQPPADRPRLPGGR